MKRGYYIIVNLLICMFFITVPVYAEQREEYGNPLQIYEGDLGVEIVSFSTNWNTKEKLKSVYDELLNNFHGEEIHYLSHIYIYPDSPEGAAGHYYEDFTYDEKGKYIYKKGRYIEIFNGDEYKDISDFARILAHEYGHHFTCYYLQTKENKQFSQWKETRYAEVRKLKNDLRVQYYSPDNLNYLHEWDISEIAAEDYVQLFGSPLAKKSRDYKDVVERIEQNIEESYHSSDSFNLLPQENLDIPLAVDVQGLYLYWLGLAGYTTAEPVLNEKPELKLVEIKDIYDDYKRYEIQWNPILEKKENYEYTLVGYPIEDNNFPKPIKTVVTGEKMSAFFGSAEGETKKILEKYEGTYEFRLFIKNSKGFMFSSKPLKISFEDLQLEKNRFQDINNDHWANKYIQSLTSFNIIQGYADGTFRPNDSITKAEYMTLLMRLDYTVKLEKQPEATHWFEKQGYFHKAKQLSIINESDYGKNFEQLKFDEPITREEMAFMAARYLSRAAPDISGDSQIIFKDIDQIHYKKEIEVVVRYEVFEGYHDQTFQPSQVATRAEASKVVWKLLNATESSKKTDDS